MAAYSLKLIGCYVTWVLSKGVMFETPLNPIHCIACENCHLGTKRLIYSKRIIGV